MNDVYDNVSDSEQVDASSELICVDLGDAVTETKQWSPIPWVVDNYVQFGWGG